MGQEVDIYDDVIHSTPGSKLTICERRMCDPAKLCPFFQNIFNVLLRPTGGTEIKTGNGEIESTGIQLERGKSTVSELI